MAPVSVMEIMMLAKLSHYLDRSTQRRQAIREKVDFETIATRNGRIKEQVRVADLSPFGFHLRSDADVSRGERLRLLLPVVGDVEAQVAWTLKGCLGGWFTYPIPPDRFAHMLGAIKTGRDDWSAY